MLFYIPLQLFPAMTTDFNLNRQTENTTYVEDHTRNIPVQMSVSE